MWYSAGTVAVTANSATVTGTGTAFSANARVSDAFRGPDGRWYEITNIASATVLSITPSYQGATASGQAYTIAPMQGYVKESADRLRQLVDQFGSQLAALQPWATSATPAAALEALGAAPLESPALTGTPTAPTPAATDTDTSIATTAFVRAAMALFGLGVDSNLTAITADLNTVLASGTYWVNASSTNKPGVDSGQLVVLASPNTATNSQLFFASRSSGVPALYFRQKNFTSSTWNPWQELWHTGNLAKQAGPNDATPGAVVMADNFAARMGNLGAPINLMRDSGRFGGAVSPQSMYVPAAFAAATGFLAAYNGSTWADAGQFFHNNSTNGGVRDALTQDVIDFLTATGRTGNTARYGVEFHIGTLTQGTGTDAQSVGPDSVTRYLSVVSSSQSCTGPGNRVTFAGWLKAKTGSAHVRADDVDLYINGVLTPGNYALPANTWVHVRQVVTSPYGYDNGFPRVYATPGAQIQFALPAYFAGEVDVGLHTAPIGHVPGLQVVGVVRQSAGEMTGAIIERGSNANGEYVRYADGTQICWVRNLPIDINIAVGALFRGLVSWTFPASFINSAPIFATSSAGGSHSEWGANATDTGGNGTTLRAMSAVSRTGSTVDGFAIGRWYV